MSDEFKVGDVVVCVREPEGPYYDGWEPRIGGIYKVVDIIPDGIDLGRMLINLAEDPTRDDETGFEENAFKHLPKADDTFINQMRSLKPAKEKTNVR